jgi:hypothetical protein
MRTYKVRANIVSAVALLVGLTSMALCGEAGKSKLRGDAFFFHLGETYDSHAYDHARILHRYDANGEPVPMEVIESQIEAIRADISAANKAYGKLSDSARKNRDTAKKLAEIATFHAGILKLCDEVDADARKTAREIKQALSSAYAASRQAASTQNILTEELDQPGHGAFSD